MYYWVSECNCYYDAVSGKMLVLSKKDVVDLFASNILVEAGKKKRQ